MTIFDIDWNDPNLLIGGRDLLPGKDPLNLSYNEYVLLLTRLPEIVGQGAMIKGAVAKPITPIETIKISGIPSHNRLCDIEALYLYLSLWLQCLTLGKSEIYPDLISSEESLLIYPYADLSLAKINYCREAWMKVPAIHEGFSRWETLWFTWELANCYQHLKIAGLILEGQDFDKDLMIKSSQMKSSNKFIKTCKQILKQKDLATADRFFAPKGRCIEDGQMTQKSLGMGIITAIQKSDKFLESHCKDFLAALERFNRGIAPSQYQIAAALPGGREYISGNKKKPPGFGTKKDNGRPIGNLKLGGIRASKYKDL